MLQNTALGLTACQSETWQITVLIYPEGRQEYSAIFLCCSCLISLLEHDEQSQKYQSSMTGDTHWQMPWLFSCVFFFYYKKMSLLLVIKDHKPTLWSLTGPQQLLNLICSISIVFANYTQSTLDFADDKDSPWRLGKWLNLGLSDALTGSCACAFSRQPRQSAFYKAVSCAVSPPEIRKHQQRVSVHIDR